MLCRRQSALTAFDVFHGDGLAASGIVGDRQHDERNTLATHFGDQALKRRHIHVAFERMVDTRLAPFRNDHIQCFGSYKFHIGPRRIEVRVVGNDVTLLAHDAEENAFGSAPLVRRDDMPVAEDVLNRVAKPVKAAAPGITLVAFHDRGPLVRGHGASARIGEEIDQDVVGRQQEEVVVCGLEKALTLDSRGPADGLDTLDTKGLDDRARHEISFTNDDCFEPSRRSIDTTP